MPVDRKKIFDAVKVLRDGRPYTQAEVAILDAAIDAAVIEPTPPLKLGQQDPVLPPATKPDKFTLSEHSIGELTHVMPKLRLCVEKAITISLIDFRVQQGLRTLAEQKAAVASGNSRTMKSKHLPQADGFAWAVDLVVLTNGQVDWSFNKYGAIAWAMDKAATSLGISDHIRWGCAWDRVLSDFGGDANAYMAEAKAYAARHAGSDLLDAPHFEWVP